jgi:hypothetical protein
MFIWMPSARFEQQHTADAWCPLKPYAIKHYPFKHYTIESSESPICECCAGGYYSYEFCDYEYERCFTAVFE